MFELTQTFPNECSNRKRVICSLMNKAAKNMVNNGYVQVVDTHREMLAGIGFASDNANLYKTGDRVQQKAAAKAASSPITSITPSSDP